MYIINEQNRVLLKKKRKIVFMNNLINSKLKNNFLSF